MTVALIKGQSLERVMNSSMTEGPPYETSEGSMLSSIERLAHEKVAGETLPAELEPIVSPVYSVRIRQPE